MNCAVLNGRPAREAHAAAAATVPTRGGAASRMLTARVPCASHPCSGCMDVCGRGMSLTSRQ